MLASTAGPASPPPTAPAPDSIALSKDCSSLIMTFAGGETRAIDAPRLRLACRCAHCTRARIDGQFPQNFEAVTIQTVAPMGHYGINIGFSDGHARGIYPWSTLAGLTEN